MGWNVPLMICANPCQISASPRSQESRINDPRAITAGPTRGIPARSLHGARAKSSGSHLTKAPVGIHPSWKLVPRQRNPATGFPWNNWNSGAPISVRRSTSHERNMWMMPAHMQASHTSQRNEYRSAITGGLSLPIHMDGASPLSPRRKTSLPALPKPQGAEARKG